MEILSEKPVPTKKAISLLKKVANNDYIEEHNTQLHKDLNTVLTQLKLYQDNIIVPEAEEPVEEAKEEKKEEAQEEEKEEEPKEEEKETKHKHRHHKHHHEE